uniref:Transcriptional regulator, AraC family with amidase-like domain n=1 Tax=uncultured Thiotrichaceae bacterium TaxID=298394 RepID=A0A6S6UK91_9GAMM|nr:MAG: Transcriptional regulator, AraC family with amidase-like domain [uncultured Thiotrichaceae bacterium]
MLNLDLVMDTLRIANRIVKETRFEWQILTVNNSPVSSCNGFVVQPDVGWSDANDLDYVLVITGFEPEQSLRRSMMCWLKMLHNAGAGLGCIDTGAFTLAAAGVLSPQQPVAIHWEFETQFRQQYPALSVNSGGIACGEHFFSASGGLSVADMMLKLLTQHIASPDKLDEVQHILYSHGSKPLAASAYALPNDPLSRIERAELHMHATLSAPLTLKELAGMVNMHPRTFARHFNERYGMTPMRYYRQLRLSQARDLLLQTHWPVSRIAELCGFAEVTNFSTCFSGYFGVSPQQMRSQPR